MDGYATPQYSESIDSLHIAAKKCTRITEFIHPVVESREPGSRSLVADAIRLAACASFFQKVRDGNNFAKYHRLERPL